MHVVERVNWLRAKARFDRWTEEFTAIRDQMGNTIRSFQNMQDKWLERAERAEQQSEGHKYYAYLQADVWGSLASRVKVAFGNNPQ